MFYMKKEMSGKTVSTLSLVVPIYGTAGLLENLLAQLGLLHQMASDCGLNFIEAIIVDDGSPNADEISSAVQHAGTSSVVPIRLVRYAENAGKGFAVATGVKNAQGDYVLMSDCDMAVSFTEFHRLAKVMGSDVWVACGSRKGQGRAARNVSLCRYVLSRMFLGCIRLAGIRKITDTQCGFKLFRRDKVLPIFNKLQIRRFAFDVEVIGEIERLDGGVREVPVVWHGGTRSTLHAFRDAPRMLYDTIRYTGSRFYHKIISSPIRLPVCGLMALIFVLATVRLAVMATSSVFDTSEARYAAITKNMAESGDFLVPRFIYRGQMVAFDGKPPLYFQLGALMCRAFPSNPGLAVRIPAFVSAVIIAFSLFWLVKRMIGREDAWRTAVAVAATPVFFFAAGFCLTDMLLSAAVVVAWVLWYRFDERADVSPGKCPLLLLSVFASLAVGMLTKGPVAFVLFGLPVACWTIWRNRWHVLRKGGWAWIAGPLLFIILAAPWFIMREREAPGFCSYFFLNENFLRFLRHDYGDRFGAGREFFYGMSFVWLLIGTLPWSLAYIRSRCEKKHDLQTIARGRLVSYSWCCVAAVTGFWCLTSRVPLLYLLPVFPMAAMAFALSTRTKLFDLSLVTMTALMVLSAVIAPIVGEQAGSKMPQKFFEQLPELMDENSVVEFPGRSPYSAEFYLEDRVVQGRDAPNAYRLCRTDSLERHPEYSENRMIVASGCGWTLFSPVWGPRFAQNKTIRSRKNANLSFCGGWQIYSLNGLSQ